MVARCSFFRLTTLLRVMFDFFNYSWFLFMKICSLVEIAFFLHLRLQLFSVRPNAIKRMELPLIFSCVWNRRQLSVHHIESLYIPFALVFRVFLSRPSFLPLVLFHSPNPRPFWYKRVLNSQHHGTTFQGWAILPSSPPHAVPFLDIHSFPSLSRFPLLLFDTPFMS